ncbi:Kinase, NEK [Giardia duodenalis ATCC 50581]|uniref:Kinase, NEK n=1 Tax=Giardia intestinalis (strain ATCC 50581 / GS clone H7) TaxID=598745 RepID=C6LRZ7_GIAIB|nr:Kinase, NEK [Giardia intestinalis ATCC 50581]
MINSPLARPAALPDPYVVDKRVATGVVGTVYRAHNSETQAPVIVKKVSYLGIRLNDTQAILDDVEALSQLSSPYLTHLESVIHDSRHRLYYLISEVCVSNLQLLISTHIKENRFLAEERIWSLLEQALKALDYLHTAEKKIVFKDGREIKYHEICHGNLKPSNVLISETGVVKLGDFTINKAIGQLFMDKASHQSVQYMAPELFSSDGSRLEYGPASDIWSLGAIIYSVAMLRAPFVAPTKDDTIKKICAGTYLPIINYSPELQNVVARMMDLSPTKRPTAASLLAHPKIDKATERFMSFLTASLPTFDANEEKHDEKADTILLSIKNMVSEEESVERLEDELEPAKDKLLDALFTRKVEKPVTDSAIFVPPSADQKKIELSQEGDTPLITAARAGDLTGCKQNLSQVTKHNRAGLTALMAAAANGHLECVKLLLEYEKGIRMRTTKWDFGFSALSWAAMNGHVDCVKVLISAEAQLVTERNVTALMYTSWWNQPACAALLIEYEAKLCDIDGRTALMMAAERNHVDCVLQLKEKELKLTMKSGYWGVGFSALSWATIRGNYEAAAVLQEEIGIYDMNGISTLMYAAWNGSVGIAKLCLSTEVGRADVFGRTALMVAAERNNLDVATLVVEREAGMASSDGRTALMKAAEMDAADVAKILIDKEATMRCKSYSCSNWEYTNVTALMIAAFKGSTNVCNLLFSKEAGLKDNSGCTALMAAAHCGHEEVCRILLPKEGGLANNAKSTALMAAASKNYFRCVEILLEKEAGMSVNNATSALTMAARCNGVDSIRLLGPREGKAFGKAARANTINNDVRALIKSYMK